MRAAMAGGRAAAVAPVPDGAAPDPQPTRNRQADKCNQ